MIGIRHEDKNEWERRAPLTPDHVAELVRNHRVPVLVEPSESRVFPDADYAAAGARLSKGLEGATLILGIKEVPPERLRRGAAYLLFAHVIKGQPVNMPTLARLMELGCTLLDYECVTDSHGRRLVYFGLHAGHAGMIDGLWALGRRLDRERIPTPFREVLPAHAYSGLDDAAHHLAQIGERIRRNGIPPEIDPIVFGFTGSGNVTRGAVEVLQRMPVEEVTVEDLPGLGPDPDRPRNVLFFVRFDRSQRYERIESGPFDSAELARHPERYRGALYRYLSYLTVLVNGAYWRPGQPTTLRLADVAALWAVRAPRLRVVADLACDVGGALETTVRVTTPSQPVYVIDPDTGHPRSGVEGRGPVVLAVDNLPCELPVESSEHFGDSLMRYVPSLARCRWDEPIERLALPDEIRKAVIVHRGALAPDFAYLGRHLPGRAAP